MDTTNRLINTYSKKREDKSLRILLINPPVKVEDIYGEYSSISPCLPPLGLCYLAAVLLKAGYNQVKVIDGMLENLSYKALEMRIRRYRPDIVGVTSTTVSFYNAKKIISLCKKINPKILTVLGGAHFSALPQRTMEECQQLDIGVYGEGEITFLDLVKKLSQNKRINSIKGTLYRRKRRIAVNPPRKNIDNLDNLPFPARHLLEDLRLYHHTPFRGRKFTVSMITSRGCPFGCSFCDQSVFGTRWRTHSPDYVVQEMMNLKKKYNIDSISFEDDNFLLSRNRAIDICEKIISNNLRTSWACSARVDNIDSELLFLMKEAGCFNIFIGIESGSNRILKLMNKKTNLTDIKKAVRLIKQNGVNVYGSFILGFPGESKDEMKKSIVFACSLPLDGVSFFLYTPHPNTTFANLATKLGKVSSDWRDYVAHPKRIPFIPHGFTELEMRNLQKLAYIKFYTRPNYLLNHPYLIFQRRIWENGSFLIGSYLITKIKSWMIK